VEKPPGRTDEEQEKLDRQLSEVLQELRVAMPGVQILFGFLLAAAFNQRFAEVDEFQKDVYAFTLVSAALATALFIAPTAYHRITFGNHDKPRLIHTATRLTILGLVCLAAAITGAVLLVTDFLFGPVTTIVVTVFVGAIFLWLWFGLALSRLLLRRRSD
jgi:uncharacterized protein DUF6328